MSGKTKCGIYIKWAITPFLKGSTGTWQYVDEPQKHYGK